MAIATLATTRYVEVGTYIGQFFLPGAGALPNEARVVCLVGKGDRTIVIRNQTLRRSFVYRKQLTFTTIAPFIANLDFAADGSQASPVRLFDSDGVEVPANKWFYVSVLGQFTQVQILDTAYSPLQTYYLDYQSTSRAVLDPVPSITVQSLSATAQLRELLAVGTLQDQPEYVEYQDLFVQYEIDDLLADVDNVNQTTGFSSVNSSAATGTGTVAISMSAAYTHQYSRLYRVECTAASGVTPTRLATLQWTSSPVSQGNAALPPTPINPSAPAPTISLDESNSLTLSNQLLELGVVMDFTFGASNYVVGDVFYVQALGPGLIEVDPLLQNTNQYTTISAIAPTLQLGSTGSASLASLPTEYTIVDHNLGFRLQCIAAAGVTPTRTATFVWCAYGTSAFSGSFVLNEATVTSLTQTLGATGIKLLFSFGATQFVVGDRFDFTVKAPRVFYKGKEAVRNVTLSVGTAANPAANQGTATGGFLADTPEGRFGNWAADTSVNQGRFEINDGLRFYVRNGYLSSLVNATPQGNRLVAGDAFAIQLRSLGVLDFSLLRQETQTFANPAEIATDVTGAITGFPGAKYITLENNPESILYVRRVSDSTAIAYSQVLGTPFLRITQSGFGVGTGDIQVLYRWRGAEPAPGQDYYVSAKYLRPDSFYNKPILFLTKGDAEGFLAPSTIRNDLFIAAGIVFDYAVPGLFTIQVRDADDDGVLSRDDFKTAIQAFRQDRRATDLVVLNFFQALPDQLQVVNICNDPFELHECITYVGTPIDTPIGSELEQGSLVYLSRKNLAVYGNSPAHGSRVLVGSTRATRTIKLEDSSSTTVTLDGSFIAAALAALVTSFATPTETVLFKTLTSFNTMQTYTDQENLLLGGNNVIFFKDEGSSIFRIREDITTDPFSPDTLNLNQMTQKQFVTRDIRRTLNDAIISLVFPSAQAGIATIQAVLVSRLSSLETRGFIGRYQDSNGNVRDINPATDAIVFRDQTDPTLFHIAYNYFLSTTAKRIFGLFTVNLPNGFPV